MVFERDVERFLGCKVRKMGGLSIKLGLGGLPDRLIVLPRGRVIFCEIKRQGGRVSAIQQVMLRKLKALGFDVYTPFSKEEVTEMLERYERK